MEVVNEYTHKSWETINSTTRDNDSLSHILDANQNIIYSAFVYAGHRLENLDQIFAKYIEPEDIFYNIDKNKTGTILEKFDPNWKSVFYVTDDKFEYANKYTIEYNWTYDSSMDISLENPVLSNSPLPLLDYRMYFVWSIIPNKNILDESGYGYVWRFDNNQIFYTHDFYTAELNLNEPFHIITDFFTTTATVGGAFSNAFDKSFNNQAGKLSYPDFDTYIKWNGYRIKVANTCHNYCLYYRNEMGGWNWLLVTGTDLQKEQYTTNSYKKNANFGYYKEKSTYKQNINYNKIIKTSWELKTQPMNDESSEKMQSLFRSNLVYLMHLDSKEIYPVNITDTQSSTKTFKNSGGQFATYTINVELAYDKKIIY